MNIQFIAEGGEFDVVLAIREMATSLLDLQQRLSLLEPAAPLEQSVAPADELATLLNVKLAGVLVQAGFGSVEALKAATDEQLLAVPGVGSKGLALIRERVG